MRFASDQSLAHPRILVAGIGNIFLGDDAFGSEVARRLMRCPLPHDVTVVDYGIRGLDLAYALLNDPEAAILVDAVPRGGSPGTLYLIEPEDSAREEAGIADAVLEAHAMDPVQVIRTATAMGARPGRVLIVGCEPATFGNDDDPAMGLSPQVEAAVEEAIRMVLSLVAQLLNPDEKAAGGGRSPTINKH